MPLHVDGVPPQEAGDLAPFRHGDLGVSCAGSEIDHEASPDRPWGAGHERIGLRGLLHLLLGGAPGSRRSHASPRVIRSSVVYYGRMRFGDKTSQQREGIAAPSPHLYSRPMSRLLNGRCAAWTRAIVLSFSVAMLGFAATGMSMRHGLAAHGVHATGAATQTTHGMPAGPCDGCRAGDKDMSGGTCAALCASTLAVLPFAESLPVPIVLRTGALLPVRSPTSHNDPPDPYPPRPAILS